jgi:hypothetical protein
MVRTARLAAARRRGGLRHHALHVRRRRGPVVGEHHEGQHLAHRHVQALQVVGAHAAHAPRQQQAVDRLHAEARHAQQQFARRAVQVDGKFLGCASAQASLGSTSSRSMPPLRGEAISSAAKP